MQNQWKMKENQDRKSKKLLFFENFRKNPLGPWEVPGVPWEVHGFFIFSSIFLHYFYIIFTLFLYYFYMTFTLFLYHFSYYFCMFRKSAKILFSIPVASCKKCSNIGSSWEPWSSYSVDFEPRSRTTFPYTWHASRTSNLVRN